jgi:hypothetical protein
MNRSAASLLGGFLLLTTSLLAHAAAPQRAEAVVDSQPPLIHTADAAGELTGLLSSDYVAPADRVLLASAPAHKQTSSKKC